MVITILYNVFTQASSGNPEEIMADDDSVQTARDISEALKTLGHTTSLFEVTDESLKKLSTIKTNIFFNQAFGVGNKPRSESEVTKFLENHNLPFTGSGTEAIDLSNDKVASKYLFLEQKIPTARFKIIDNPEKLDYVDLSYPLIVKLTNEHSSIGLDGSSVVKNKEDLQKKVKSLFYQYKRNILVEEYVDGKEINATILGGEVLPLSEVTFGKYFDTHAKFIDFKAKWKEGDPAYEESVGVCPANIDPETENRIKDIAMKVHVLSGCTGYSRIDFRLDKSNLPFVLEVNANPGIGKADGAIRSAKAAGYSYPEFLEKICLIGLSPKQ